MYRQTRTIAVSETEEVEITVIYHSTGLTMRVTFPDGASKEVVWTPEEGREIHQMMQIADGRSLNKYV